MGAPLKVKDIHFDGVQEEFDRLTLLDLEILLKKKDAFQETPCPACHSTSLSEAFTHQGLPYKRCDDCELLFISPAPSEEMHLDYVCSSQAMRYWRENMPEEMKRRRQPMYDERVSYSLDIFNSLNISPKSSLEIGAGNGEFAHALSQKSAIEKITILEPQELAVDDEKINLIKGGFDELASVTERFEAIFAWELIEHLLEPDNFLQLLRKCLAPGAPLILSTPNEKSIETRTLSTASSNILFDHVRLYNPHAMEKLLHRNGFKIISLTTPGALDAEKLHTFYQEHPEHFSSQPELEFLMKQNDPELLAKYQDYLKENLLSSHMRVVAIADDSWSPESQETSNTPPSSMDTQNDPDTEIAPTNFNDVVLPHAREELESDYPRQMMTHILHDIVKIHEGHFVDLGGGWGHHAKIAQRMGFNVTSLDREAADSDVPYAICDFLEDTLPFEDNSVDIIFSKSVIEHFYVNQLPHLMGEIQRVLRPGGAFIALTPDWENNMKNFYRIFTHVTPYTKNSLEHCLKMYGFSNVTAQNFIQLPSTWNNPILHKLSMFTSYLPLPRRLNKWVRWSQEQALLGIGYKS